MIDECGFFDVPYENDSFSWVGYRRTVGLVKEKLDRVLVSNDWLGLFSNVKAHVLDHHVLDHCPISINLNPVSRQQQGCNKRVCFEGF